MSDTFTRDKLSWLDQVAADSAVLPSAFKLAYVLASRFLNRQSGDAFPRQEQLAEAAGMSERTVRTLIDQLVEHGHLEVIRGRPCRYRPILANRKPTSDNDCGKPEADFRNEPAESGSALPVTEPEQPSLPEIQRTETGSGLPVKAEAGFRFHINPLNKPSEEPIEGDMSLPAVRSPAANGSRNGAADFQDWYAAYPKHVGEDAARKAHSRIVSKGQATPAELLAGAERYAAERVGQDPQFTAAPAKWLNDGRWKDEPAPARPSSESFMERFVREGDV